MIRLNINEHAEELKKEEQKILDILIEKMDEVIDNLDQRMKNYVDEAKNSDISVNPDLYLSRILAQNGLKETKENKKKWLNAKDELYTERLLLQYKDSEEEGIEEVKVGLHSCGDKDKLFVLSWYMPLCRHFVLNNTAEDYDYIRKDKYGEEYCINYKLLVRNQVKLRFTRVVSALNLVPGVFDEVLMNQIKGTGYFSDSFLEKMIQEFNPDEYDPNAAAKIISDEFLQELLERRSTPEFKNIVFSIQKKQGVIIQAPYNRNIIVQGCAGSGKSMIMLHRLPIILYDNPKSLNRSNLYIITPTQMYIEMAENMRHQLEISDIKMGTIEQYFDYCIQKYAGHKAGEYGKINYHTKLTTEKEKYIYSKECIEDINSFLDKNCKMDMSFLEPASQKLSVPLNLADSGENYLSQIRSRVLNCQKIINANNVILSQYYAEIRNTLDALDMLSTALRHRKDNTIRNINKAIYKEKETISDAQKRMKTYDPVINAQAIENRKIEINESNDKIEILKSTLDSVYEDEGYFKNLMDIGEKLQEALIIFEDVKKEFAQNDDDTINEAVNNIGKIIGAYFMISWDLSKVEDKYSEYQETIAELIDKAQGCVNILQNENKKYLEYTYFTEIKNKCDLLIQMNEGIVKNAYAFIMNKIGIRANDNGKIRALSCSPYLYLQILYQFQGRPNNGFESFLSIDEAQGIALEEIRLLYNVNDGKTVFNMFGDVYQHIEGTKGIDSWSEYADVLTSDMYEMQENYRNASQITDFCNKQFGMNMSAINTPEKGVHEILSDEEFYNEMIAQLVDTQRAGLAAILVGDDKEARYLLNRFGAYENKFHDMTIEEFSLHRTRWNIINIDDAKGLEFSTVIVLSGRMSRNEKYIAYTRALDELFVYSDVIDVTGIEGKSKQAKTNEIKENVVSNASNRQVHGKHISTSNNSGKSAVRDFFKNSGFEVIDNRRNGGRLWIIGEKKDIRDTVNSAITQFGISGKYASSKETNLKNGWYTKTDK